MRHGCHDYISKIWKQFEDTEIAKYLFIVLLIQWIINCLNTRMIYEIYVCIKYLVIFTYIYIICFEDYQCNYNSLITALMKF